MKRNGKGRKHKRACILISGENPYCDERKWRKFASYLLRSVKWMWLLKISDLFGTAKYLVSDVRRMFADSTEFFYFPPKLKDEYSSVVWLERFRVRVQLAGDWKIDGWVRLLCSNLVAWLTITKTDLMGWWLALAANLYLRACYPSEKNIKFELGRWSMPWRQCCFSLGSFHEGGPHEVHFEPIPIQCPHRRILLLHYNRLSPGLWVISSRIQRFLPASIAPITRAIIFAIGDEHREVFVLTSEIRSFANVLQFQMIHCWWKILYWQSHSDRGMKP